MRVCYKVQSHRQYTFFRNDENRLFAGNVLNWSIGNAEINPGPDTIPLDQFGISTNTMETLLNMVVPEFLQNYMKA